MNRERLTELEQEASEFEVSKEAQKAVLKKGFHFPDKPKDSEFPHDITSVSSEKLGKLHARYQAWKEYAGTMLALAEIKQREAERKFAFMDKQIFLYKGDDEEQKVTFTKAKTAISKDLRPYIHAVDLAEAKVGLLSIQVDSFNDKLFLISREMTRRQGDYTSSGGHN